MVPPRVFYGADILTVVARLSADGIISVPSGWISFMSVSATNIGAGDASA